MTAIAEPPQQCDAETTTAPVLQTLEPAGYRTGRWLVNADWTRLEPWYGSKDGCAAPGLQDTLAGRAASTVVPDRSQLESDMSDERPLHELIWKDVAGTDREREWWAAQKEAAKIFKDAENLMFRWGWANQFAASDLKCRQDYVNTFLKENEREGKTPFEGRYPVEQLNRVWGFLRLMFENRQHQMWEDGCSDEEIDRKVHELNLMFKLMWEGARPGDVAPEPAAPAPVADRSESPIERALLSALRWSVTLSADPACIKEDCERANDKRGIFLYQQATVLHYRADFLLGAMSSPDAKPHWVVVECDGHEFHERTAEQAEHDRARDRAMTAAGYQVFRFTGREIQRDAGRCAAEVLRYLRPFAGGGDA